MKQRRPISWTGVALIAAVVAAGACSDDDSASFSPSDGDGGEAGEGGQASSGAPGVPEGGQIGAGGAGQGEAGGAGEPAAGAPGNAGAPGGEAGAAGATSTAGAAGSSAGEASGTGGAGGAPSEGGAAGADAGGGGEAGSGEGGASTGGSGSSDDVVADAQVTPDLAGLPTLLNGAGSEDPLGQDLAFDWTITAVPEGSGVSNASLGDDTLEEISFVSDLGGTYEVSLTVTAEDGRSDSDLVEFEVPTALLPYLVVQSTAAGATARAGVLVSDGMGNGAIGCDFSLGATDEESLIDNFDIEIGVSTDAWYPDDPLGDALFAFPTSTTTDAIGLPQAATIEIRSTASTCGGAPLATLAEAIGPSFSPDGARVAYGSSDVGGIVTTSVTGTSTRTIKDGVSASIAGAATPFWLSNSRVGWVESSAGGGAFDVWAGDDSATPAPEPLMLCTNEAGEFTAVRWLATTSAGLAGIFLSDSLNQSLYVLQPMGGPYSCIASDHDPIYTVDDAANEIVGFEVSPDGEQLAIVFGATTSGTSITQLSLGDPAGAPLLPIASGDVRFHGPHFIGGGRQIIFSFVTYDTSGTYPRAATTGLARSNPDGTGSTPIIIASSDATTALLVTTGGHACSVSFRPARGTELAPIALALLAFCRRRRRGMAGATTR